MIIFSLDVGFDNDYLLDVCFDSDCSFDVDLNGNLEFVKFCIVTEDSEQIVTESEYELITEASGYEFYIPTLEINF